MDVFRSLDTFAPPAGGVALSIGNFDGVHRGHQRILAAARDMARRRDMPVIALTFEPHPIAVLRPEHAPPRLTTGDEKLALLAAAEVDATIVVASSPEFLDQTAEEFIALLRRWCNPRVIVEGPSFNFGRGRAGSIDSLRRLADQAVFELCVVDCTRAAGLADAPEINSSAIRHLITAGNVADARVMLGRPHRVVGRVISGEHRGHALGFPTANLDEIPQLLPGLGVYAAVAQLDDGRTLLAAVNVGPQPTFGQASPRVEAHLLDFDDDLRGRQLGLHFIARLRRQREFARPDDLVAQLHLDTEQVRVFTPDRQAISATGLIPL